MATLTVQDQPVNAGELAITFTAADVAGDTFANDGNTVFLVQWGAAPSGDVTIEGVPSADSGRDGTSTMAAAAENSLTQAGPFKARNWNSAGAVDVTYPSGVTDIMVAAVRLTRG